MGLRGVELPWMEDSTSKTTEKDTGGTVDHRNETVVVGALGVIGGLSVACLIHAQTVKAAR